jgi:D-sedoheptulose 7-phosphate isomerase
MTTVADACLDTHLSDLRVALDGFGPAASTAGRWGRMLATTLTAGGRLLVAGNGGSAAQAQHLSAEIVGRYRSERPPMSALALHTDTSAMTAIVNDYGPDELFARQVQAHAGARDICIFLSTSGRSRNLIVAAERARSVGAASWSITGPLPNPLAAMSDEVLEVRAATTAAVQELHLVAVHLICEALDDELGLQA